MDSIGVWLFIGLIAWLVWYLKPAVQQQADPPSSDDVNLQACRDTMRAYLRRKHMPKRHDRPHA